MCFLVFPRKTSAACLALELTTWLNEWSDVGMRGKKPCCMASWVWAHLLVGFSFTRCLYSCTCIAGRPGGLVGSPRMLLVLAREFESRRGEILNLFAKIKKRINC